MDRTIEQWKKAIAEDQRLIRYYVERAIAKEEGDDPLQMWDMAIKEARRMESDLFRMAAAAGVTREQIIATDSVLRVGPAIPVDPEEARKQSRPEDDKDGMICT